MSIESGAVQRKESAPVKLPSKLVEDFISGTLGKNNPLVEEADDSRVWRCEEREVELPSMGKALLRVDYRKFDSHGDPSELFDQMRFDYVKADVGEKDKPSLIAEMHWYIEKGETQNPYPFDLMMVHRYVVPEYRDSKGIGKSLYKQAEAWAQQVADAKGEDQVLALSTDQPLTMKWAEGLGYAPYPEEEERYQEAIEHPERFELVSETDSKGQERNPALKRDGRGHRIWFRKILTAQPKVG